MNLNNFLSTTAFTSLLLLMLLYWSQAAFFGREKYKIVNNFVFLLAILSVTMLLVIRWIESGHFPSSNLYESLLFLSWCFLSLRFLSPSTKPIFALRRRETVVAQPSIDSKGCTYVHKESSAEREFAEQNWAKQEFGAALELRKEQDLVFAHTCNEGASTGFGQLLYSQSEGTQMGFANRREYGTSFKDDEKINNLSSKLEFSDLGLGVVLSPLSLLTFGFAFLSLPKEMQQSLALVPALQSNWLMMHVTVMISSYALLFSGSILSIVFLISVEYIKWSAKTKSSAVPRTVEHTEEPVLNVIDCELTRRLDNYSYRILALGFPLLTIGILSGAVWANEAWGSYWSWDPKETWALITWLVFAIYLHTRITKGWTGTKPAIVASIGFLMVWFCYLGVNLLGQGLHSYGWFSNNLGAM